MFRGHGNGAVSINICMLQSARFLLDRLKEPSTYGAIATVILTVGESFPEFAPFTRTAAALLGLVAFFVREGGNDGGSTS